MFCSRMSTAPKADHLKPHVSSRKQHVGFEFVRFCTSAVAKHVLCTSKRIYSTLKGWPAAPRGSEASRRETHAVFLRFAFESDTFLAPRPPASNERGRALAGGRETTTSVVPHEEKVRAARRICQKCQRRSRNIKKYQEFIDESSLPFSEFEVLY